VISLAYETTLAWNVPLKGVSGGVTRHKLNPPCPSTEMITDGEHDLRCVRYATTRHQVTHDVLGEEDNENEAEHGNEADLDDPAVAVSLLEPGRGENGAGAAREPLQTVCHCQLTGWIRHRSIVRGQIARPE
jgi:hypothetical protein